MDITAKHIIISGIIISILDCILMFPLSILYFFRVPDFNGEYDILISLILAGVNYAVLRGFGCLKNVKTGVVSLIAIALIHFLVFELSFFIIDCFTQDDSIMMLSGGSWCFYYSLLIILLITIISYFKKKNT